MGEVPEDHWIPEPVFDSSMYLGQSAVGEDELPGYDPDAPPDPDDDDLTDLA